MSSWQTTYNRNYFKWLQNTLIWLEITSGWTVRTKRTPPQKKALFSKHILGGSIVIFGIETAMVFWY